MKNLVNKLVMTLAIATMAVLFMSAQPVQAANYNTVVASGSNTLVGTTAVQLNNTDTYGYTSCYIWEDSNTFDVIVYLGGTDAMYITIPGGKTRDRELFDFIPPDKTNGYYVKTTVAAGVKINFIGLKEGN